MAAAGADAGARGARPPSASNAEAFKSEYPASVHVLPEGEESGGAEWTCAVKPWESWSATGNPRVQEPVGTGCGFVGSILKRFRHGQSIRRRGLVEGRKERRRRERGGGQAPRRTMTASARDLTQTLEDVVLLGTRVEPPKGDVFNLPQEAQPEGTKLRPHRPGWLPSRSSSYGECATCINGAGLGSSRADVGPSPRTHVSPAPTQELDGTSAAWYFIQQWADWSQTQTLTLDYQADAQKTINTPEPDDLAGRRQYWSGRCWSWFRGRIDP